MEKSAALVAYEMTFYPTSQALVLAGEDKYCQATTRLARAGMNELDRTGREFWKRKELGDTLKFTKMGFKLRKQGVEKGYFSELHCITCHNNPQATIGKTPSLVIMEEGGKFGGLSDTYQYIEPSMKQGGKRDGRLIIIQGTGGEMDQGVGEMMDMFYNPEAYDLLAFDNTYEDVSESNKICMFIPAWKFYKIDKDGNSNYDEGMVAIDADRARIAKLKDSAKMTNEITQMPKTPMEAFTLSGTGKFNTAKLGEQRLKIVGSEVLRSLPQYGNLTWVKEGTQIVGVEWEAGTKNELTGDNQLKYPFMIIEHPDLDENGVPLKDLYYGGTDPYDQDDAPTSDSKGSCSLFKGFHSPNKTSMMYVARYTDRPKTSKMFYENTAKLMYYYGCYNLIEHSNLGILNWYVDNGFEWMLKEKPMLAYSNTIDTQTVNKYGISAQTKPFWESNYADYIEEHYFNMFDLESINRAITYRAKVNDDITISNMLAYLHFSDEMDLATEEGDNQKDEDVWEGCITGSYSINGNSITHR
jgi:hypothetical protein